MLRGEVRGAMNHQSVIQHSLGSSQKELGEIVPIRRAPFEFGEIVSRIHCLWKVAISIDPSESWFIKHKP